MGYYMYMEDCNFVIKKENFSVGLDLLKKYCKSKVGGMMWVTPRAVLRSNTLEEALNRCRYDVTYDSVGNICSLSFNGENLGDDDGIWESIAPAVESGSFINMVGEDGYHWRWLFKNGECIAQEGKMVYE